MALSKSSYVLRYICESCLTCPEIPWEWSAVGEVTHELVTAIRGFRWRLWTYMGLPLTWGRPGAGGALLRNWKAQVLHRDSHRTADPSLVTNFMNPKCPSFFRSKTGALPHPSTCPSCANGACEQPTAGSVCLSEQKGRSKGQGPQVLSQSRANPESKTEGIDAVSTNCCFVLSLTVFWISQPVVWKG